MVRTILLLLFVVTPLTDGQLFAQVWNETGDAPSLPPGQITVGSGPLTTIRGTIANPDFDPDVYCINITDVGAFSATTVGSTATDLSLWLFDSTFDGVAHDGADDANSGPNPGYQASLSNAFVSSPGIHFLAISHGGVDALNSAAEIWDDQPTIENAPNGLGAPGPISGWTTPGFGLAGAYAIHLTGAGFHGEIPEPWSVVLFGMAMCGSSGLIARDRRATRVHVT